MNKMSIEKGEVTEQGQKGSKYVVSPEKQRKKGSVIAGEIWKDIEGHGGNFEASSSGWVRNKITGEFLNLILRNNAVAIRICYQGKRTTYDVRRIVANLFLDKVAGKDCVIHKDEDIYNISMDNLQWMSRDDIAKRLRLKNKEVEEKEEGEIIEGEEWKVIKKWGDKYEVSDRGRIRYSEDKSLMKLTKGDRHMVVRLNHNGRGTTISVKALVAEYFMKAETDKTKRCLINIDGDITNNVVTNLQFSDRSTIMTESMVERKEQQLKVTPLENIEGEIWKDVNGYDGAIEVSTNGRVREKASGHIYKPIYNGYSSVTIKLPKNKTRVSHHVKDLVAEHFLEKVEGKHCVVHIDDDVQNNKLENLRWK